MLWFFVYRAVYRLHANNNPMLTFTTSLALFLSAVTLNNNTILAATTSKDVRLVKSESAVLSAVPESAPIQKDQGPIVISVGEYVKKYYAENPILAKIAKCESHYRQFDKDGKVLRGEEVYEDVGVMQINETYHATKAKELGYNIYSLDGNLAFGQYLYDMEGTQPWSASRSCWGY